MGERITTANALAIFPPASPIQVTEFEGEKDRGSQWVSAKDLPPMQTVGELMSYLKKNDDIALVDFAGTISDAEVLSTHDDWEASLTVTSQARAIEILREFIEPTALETLLANPGKYISVLNGMVKIFSTFDDWVEDKRNAVS